MQFIILLQLTPHYMVKANWTDEAIRIREAHWNHLVDLNSKGLIKIVARTSYDVDHPENFGLSLLEAESLEAATEIMNSDPCVVHSLMNAKVHPMSIFMFDGKVMGG